MHERIPDFAVGSERAARAKSLPAGEKTMVGWDGIEPPTPGFSAHCPGDRNLPASVVIVAVAVS